MTTAIKEGIARRAIPNNGNTNSPREILDAQHALGRLTVGEAVEYLFGKQESPEQARSYKNKLESDAARGKDTGYYGRNKLFL